MVETPKLSSLAGELLRFFLISSFLVGVLISLVFYLFAGINPYQSFALGFFIAAVWVFFNILWTKGKLEELFARIMYVIELLEEKQKGKTVVPVPIHEEMLDIVNSIRELVASFEEKYERQIRDLEDQIESISENSTRILRALEKMEEGYLKTEFPTGLDPVGAIGQAMQQVCDVYREKFTRVKEFFQECRKDLEELALLLEESEDKIEVHRIKEIVNRLARAEERIEEELGFLKDI